MNGTVLIIDDDKVLRSSLVKGLKTNNFYVIDAESAEKAKPILARIIPDAIILDRMMAGLDGLSFLKEIRRHGNNIPVIMLTAMDSSENIIEGLESGADDYLSKPFQLKELILRLKNIIKKSKKDTDVSLKNLIFEKDDFYIISNNQKILLQLSTEEKNILSQLISPIGNIVSATPMIVKRLRIKLKSILSSIQIVTVRGIGYKIIKGTSDEIDT